MKGFSIKTGSQWIESADLTNMVITDTYTDHEKKAILFCQSWFSNKTDFDFHTSGSTGIPKKISFKRKQLVASALLTAKALQLQPGNTSLVCLDVDFIAGAMMLVRGMEIGMNMIIRSPSADPVETISEHIDFAALVPYQVVHLLQHDISKFLLLEKVIVGGAPLNQETIEALQTLSSQFYATYGMTETITHVALQKLNGSDRQDYFQMLPGINASVDDRGCLIIEPGHLGIEAVITNDIVELISNNKFKWIGRYDRVINSGGVKVNPEKIEKKLQNIFKELKIHNRYFVGSIADEKLGQQVVLVVESKALGTDVEENIFNELIRTLNKYEVPKKIFSIESFIETPTQKIDRTATLKSVYFP